MQGMARSLDDYLEELDARMRCGWQPEEFGIWAYAMEEVMNELSADEMTAALGWSDRDWREVQAACGTIVRLVLNELEEEVVRFEDLRLIATLAFALSHYSLRREVAMWATAEIVN